MSVSNKPHHPALKLVNSSLLAKNGELPRETVFEYPFPLPGADYLTIQTMSPHTAVIGATGTGKTIILKHLMSSVLPASVQEGTLRFRAVIYDPKRELYPFLNGLGISKQQIIVTHPFDARSAAWNLAQDFVEPAQIEELAEMIVPKSDSKSVAPGNEFFESTSRIIFQDVIQGLIAVRPHDWELRDIVESISSLNRLKAILRKTPDGADSWNAYLSPLERDRHDRTALSIHASLMTYSRPFRSLAALWNHAERQFSLEQWHCSSGIILLGADPSRDRTMQRVNQLLMKRASQLTLSRNEERPLDLTWFFLDEIREAGRLDGLRRLMTEGRSKGIRVVLGFQDIEGMYELYGEHQAEEMIGLCANRLVLHLDNPKTRKWASEFFGEAEVVQPTKGFADTTGYTSSSSDSTQYGLGLKANMLPIEFHNLPLGNPTDGVELFFSVPGRRNRYHFSSELAQQAIAYESRSESPAFVPRPASHQKLKRWTPEELQSIGLRRKLSKGKSKKLPVTEKEIKTGLLFE